MTRSLATNHSILVLIWITIRIRDFSIGIVQKALPDVCCLRVLLFYYVIELLTRYLATAGKLVIYYLLFAFDHCCDEMSFPGRVPGI